MQLHEYLSGSESDVIWRSSEAEMLLASLLRVFASSEPRARQNRVFSRQRRASPPHQRAKCSNYPDPTRAAGREKTVFHKRTRVLARHSINGPPQKNIINQWTSVERLRAPWLEPRGCCTRSPKRIRLVWATNGRVRAAECPCEVSHSPIKNSNMKFLAQIMETV